jgi:hypothetical protein
MSTQISLDQNTVIHDGVRYVARTSTNGRCRDQEYVCAFSGDGICNAPLGVPCFGCRRADGENKLFIKAGNVITNRQIMHHTTGPHAGLWGRNISISGCKARGYYRTRAAMYADDRTELKAVGEYMQNAKAYAVRYDVHTRPTMRSGGDTWTLETIEPHTLAKAKAIIKECRQQGEPCRVNKVTTETVMVYEGRG